MIDKIYQCKRCGAKIVWLKTARGCNMPVNADTVTEGDKIYVPHEMEEIKAADGNWRWQKRERHVAHWATCPDAAEFRRAKK